MARRDWLLPLVMLAAACGGRLVEVGDAGMDAAGMDAAGIDAAGIDAAGADASEGVDLATAEFDMGAPPDLRAAQPPPITDARVCMATPQPSIGLPNGVVLQRQCTGRDSTTPIRQYQVSALDWLTLDNFWGGASWGNYPSGKTDAPMLNRGYYTAVAFVPPAGDARTIGLDYSGTYGTGAVMSFSTTPGDFTGSLGRGCYVAWAHNARAWTGAPIDNPSVCNLNPDGKTVYYLNIAGVYDDGTPIHWESSYYGKFTDPVPIDYGILFQ